MPKDSKGNFHLSTQRAIAADKRGGEEPKPLRREPKPMLPPEPAGSDVPSHLTDMQAQMGGKHLHVHSDGMTHTVHHVGEDGQVSGPHHTDDPEEVKEIIDRFLNEEIAELGEGMEA